MTVLIATLALAFTVLSFWWIQVRRGRLEAYEPWIYSGAFLPTTMRLRLPLAVYNTGARTLVVTDLRLVWKESGVVAPAISFRDRIRPEKKDVLDFCHPFRVPGRQVVTHFVEFGTDGSWLPEVNRRYDIQVDARVGSSKDWNVLMRLSLTTPSGDRSTSYISHPTDPDNYPYRTAELDRPDP